MFFLSEHIISRNDILINSHAVNCSRVNAKSLCNKSLCVAHRYPSPTIRSHSSSLSTATPSSLALPSFEPAPGPATT
jgi:hypothetical protein